MTRINYGIPVKKLTDQHLLAEIRELPRIPRKVKNNIQQEKPLNILKGKFRLGEGHVRFFYNKLGYLHQRYLELRKEAYLRGFNIKYKSTRDSLDLFYFDSSILESKLLEYYNDSFPQKEDIQVVKERISERIRNSNQIPRFNKNNIDKELYIKEILGA